MPQQKKPTTSAQPLPNVDTEISFIEPPAPDEVEIAEQKEHYQLPTRFGAVPVDEADLGWEVETRRRADGGTGDRGQVDEIVDSLHSRIER